MYIKFAKLKKIFTIIETERERQLSQRHLQRLIREIKDSFNNKNDKKLYSLIQEIRTSGFPNTKIPEFGNKTLMQTASDLLDILDQEKEQLENEPTEQEQQSNHWEVLEEEIEHAVYQKNVARLYELEYFFLDYLEDPESDIYTQGKEHEKSFFEKSYRRIQKEIRKIVPQSILSEIEELTDRINNSKAKNCLVNYSFWRGMQKFIERFNSGEHLTTSNGLYKNDIGKLSLGGEILNYVSNFVFRTDYFH